MPATGYRQRQALLPGAVVHAAAYALDGLEEGVHRGLPSPWLTFIVAVDDPVRVAGTVDEAQSFDPARATSYDVIMAGLHPAATLVAQPERQSGVEVAVHPLAARQLFGCSAAELPGHGAHGDEVVGGAAVELHERVGDAPTADQRLDVLQGWLRRRAGDQPVAGVRPELWRAWQLAERSQGRIRVDRMAREVQLSERQLRTLMRAETGLSPKQLCRHFRFSSVVSRLASGAGSLAAIAAETGYADQAHLTREFSRMAGCSPSRWLAEERRNIQDGGHRGAGDSRHGRDD